MKWLVEQSQSDIEYIPRVTIKGQALVDFLAEFSPKPTLAVDGKIEEVRWKL